MNIKSSFRHVLILSLASLLFFSPISTALAQQQTDGVVTGIQGQAQLTRPAVAPTSLKFKDGVVIRDVVDTKEKSLARILFGGRSTVTVRELSRLEVREELLPGGARRDVHDLSSGAILVNVARQLMRPGDEVQIRTPNAVAAVRGSTIFAAFNALLNQSFFALLSGTALVTPQGAPPVNLTPNTGANITGSGPGLQVSQLKVTAAQANQILAESNVGRAVTEEGNRAAVVETAVNQAAALANAVVETVTESGQRGGGGEQQQGGAGGEVESPSTTAPIVADTTSSTSTKGSGGTPPMWESNFGSTLTALNCDDCGTTKTLNFTFPFRGENFTQIELSSNGFLFLGTPGGSTDHFNPSVSEFLSGPKRVALVWADFYPPGGGSVKYNDSASDHVTITWDAVPYFDHNSPVNTVQMQLYSNGKIIFSYMTLHPTDTTDSNNAIIGVTPGNGATDPGERDLAGSTSFNTGSDGTVYEFFSFNESFGLDGMSIIFTPNGSGWDVLVDDVGAFLSIAEGDIVNHLSATSLVDFGRISFNIGGSFYTQSGGSVTLGGSLLRATDSTMKIGTDSTLTADLVNVREGGQLVLNSDAPLIQLSGGTLTIGTHDGTANNSPNRLIYVGGVNIDPATGLGTDQPIRGNGLTPASFPGASQPVGTLLKATDGASIEVLKGAGDESGGNAVKIDTALLEATMPIIHLIGSANTQTSLTTDSSTIDLVKSKLISLGPVIAMDKSFINVTNGALINVVAGSNMKVTGDLISMFTGSKINVVNGPLISVIGSGSLLDVSGALVNFGGSGGNKIVVNNSISPTATLSGIPVSATFGGSVNIANPIKNPSLGSISVNGSLISATNGGTVNIQGK